MTNTYYAWLAEFNGPRIVRLKAKSLEEAVAEIGEEGREVEDTGKAGMYEVGDHTIFEGSEGVLELLDGVSEWYSDRLAEMSPGLSFTLGEEMNF